MLLTGEFLPAERAERLGFVNRITEPGGARAEAVALAEQVCANAPLAVQSALASANEVLAAGRGHVLGDQ